ncbi:MAG: UvrD-helicase domain-containing protein [Candidatus Cloacimonetes bacterium]|nr:UvrD-helicase domain-containing protein [Candidatus Cloacimonadota bacterium]
MAIPISASNVLDYLEEAESKLLKPGDHFDEQSREFICCLDRKDVIACPGSGKTTALVAKLYILTKFMPFEDGSGICVLTHTNVAIDLIKEKLGKQGSILFEHPNFCGTIQSFVDKYLAQPMFVSIFGHRINTIDDDIAYSYLITKLKQWRAVNERIHFLESIKNLRIDFPTGNLIDRKGQPFSIPFTSEGTKYIRDEIKSRKASAITKGILFYDEAYCLGQSYLNENQHLSGAFSNRFKHVFVDEAQDTSSVQYSIITTLFSESVIQMIGDPNQTIYDNAEAADNDETCTWTQVANSRPHIRIHNSKRLSAQIASSIKSIAEFPEQNLHGHQNGCLRPILIFYSHDRILEVIPKFADLISLSGLSGMNKYPHKAIGRVVKKNSDANHFTVPSFYPEYYRTMKKQMLFDGLRQYLVKPKNSEAVRQVKQVSDLLVSSLIRMLTLAQIYDSSSRRKPYTKTSLIEYLSKWHQEKFTCLLTKLSSWSRRILSHACRFDCPDNELQYPRCVLNEIVIYVEEIFFPLFEADFSKIQSFIECEVEEIQSGLHLDNEFHGFIDGQDIRIDVSSVHAVKGETHTSTLFLDTFFRAYDSTRLVRFFTSGGRDADRRNDSICKALRVAYVAMSRPTHLLCVAFPLPEGQPILEYWQSKPELERLWDIETIQ